jgi:hypothetical protein
MITRTLMTVAIVIALASAAGATDEARHSGTIVGLREQPTQIIMEEIVAWTGPDSGRVRRTIDVTPETSIQVVRRTDTWGSSRTSKGSRSAPSMRRRCASETSSPSPSETPGTPPPSRWRSFVLRGRDRCRESAALRVWHRA